MIYILQVGQNELAVRVLTNAGAPLVLEPTRGGHLIVVNYLLKVGQNELAVCVLTNRRPHL